MTIIIVIAAMAVVGFVLTVHHLATDGYHRRPTCPEAIHHYR